MKDIMFSSDKLLTMYTTMVRIRHFEETVADMILSKEIVTPCHLYIGQEAVATGVCSSLRKKDWVFSNHRSHGHYIAKGGDLNSLMAELFCKTNGCSKGNGGSMHITCPSVGLPGSSAIVSGTIPLAVGAAYSFMLQKKDNVSVVFFGDGSTNEGVFYESINLAALKKLPVVFVCENNLYSTHMPISSCLADTDICKKVEAFGVPAIRINGNDVRKVFNTAQKMINDARDRKGPAFLECMTYRWRGHVGPYFDIDKSLRSKEEVDHWMKKCPIKQLEEYLMKKNILSESKKHNIYRKVKKEITESIKYKDNSWSPGDNQMTSVFKEK